MRTIINPAADERCPALEPGHALIDALDGNMKCNRMIERRHDMRESAERAAGRVCCGRRGVGSAVTMLRADHNTAQRIRGCGGSRAHHRDRCKKLHQNRDHHDGNQTSQPLAHCHPHRMKSGCP